MTDPVIGELREPVTPTEGTGALTVGSLFSGIGGLDLGLERAGMEVRWQSEIDPYACRVLAKNYPHVPNLGDVTMIDWSSVELPDLLAAGFPCQPFSSAGLQRGAADERYLWPEVVRALRVLRPRFALLENVAGLLAAPEFGVVLGDLAELGYDAEWDCIPAAAVGAPHLRYRVFIVAHHDGSGGHGSARVQAGWDEVHANLRVHAGRLRVGQSEAAHVADADQERRGGRPRVFGPSGRRQLANCGGWLPEPDVGRMVTGVPSRVDRLRALGNAVVPQVAQFVGESLLASLGDSKEERQPWVQ